MQLDLILKVLEEEFEIIVKLFQNDEWKFFKFSQEGPYKRTLTRLQKLANERDQKIFDRFGIGKETASFSKLVALAISVADEPKEKSEIIDTFRRQIQFMRRTQ